MLDTPKIIQRSIVIFSKAENVKDFDLWRGVAPQQVKCMPQFSAATGLTVTGGISNDFLKIAPDGAGGFSVKIKKCNFYWRGSFAATLKTTGGDGFEPVEMFIAIPVIVYGADLPELSSHFVEMPVGRDTVDVVLNGVTNAGSYHTVTVGTGSLRSASGHDSGLSSSGVYDAENTCIGARISGIPRRPGVYAFQAIVYSNDDRRNVTNRFPTSYQTVAVVVSVYDHAYRPDCPVVVFPDAPITHNAAALRCLAVPSKSVYGDDIYFAVGDWEQSGAVWTKRKVKTFGTFSTYNHIWEQKIELSGGFWQLSARQYTEGDAIPSWSLVASVKSETWRTFPPKSGWPAGWVFDGDARIYYPGRDFFALAGSSAGGAEIFEQLPAFTPDFAGWDYGVNEPPSGELLTRSAAGVWSSNVPVDFDASQLVELNKGVAIPCFTPRAGDLTLAAAGVASSINADPTASPFAVAASGVAGGSWSRYPLRRLLDRSITRHGALEIEHASSSSSESSTLSETQAINFIERYFSNGSTYPDCKKSEIGNKHATSSQSSSEESFTLKSNVSLSAPVLGGKGDYLTELRGLALDCNSTYSGEATETSRDDEHDASVERYWAGRMQSGGNWNPGQTCESGGGWEQVPFRSTFDKTSETKSTTQKSKNVGAAGCLTATLYLADGRECDDAARLLYYSLCATGSLAVPTQETTETSGSFVTRSESWWPGHTYRYYTPPGHSSNAVNTPTPAEVATSTGAASGGCVACLPHAIRWASGASVEEKSENRSQSYSLNETAQKYAGTPDSPTGEFTEDAKELYDHSYKMTGSVSYTGRITLISGALAAGSATAQVVYSVSRDGKVIDSLEKSETWDFQETGASDQAKSFYNTWKTRLDAMLQDGVASDKAGENQKFVHALNRSSSKSESRTTTNFKMEQI